MDRDLNDMCRPLAAVARHAIAVAAALLLAGGAQAGDFAWHETNGSTIIEAPAAIIANQDLVLGRFLRVRREGGSGLDRRRASGGRVSAAANGRDSTAYFLIVGGDRSMSVSIPTQVALTSASAQPTLMVDTETSTAPKLDLLKADRLLDRDVLMIKIRDHVSYGVQPLSGVYRGVLVATAQYD